MKKIFKFVIIICTCMILAKVNVSAGNIMKIDEVNAYLDRISKVQMSLHNNPSNGSVGGEWTVFSLARGGRITNEYKNKYCNNLKKKLDECEGVLSKRKYSEYSRTVIALAAIGEDPENFYGYNLVLPLTKFEQVATQGINGIAYALLALNTGKYFEDSKIDIEKYKRDIVERLLAIQLNDGGWAMSGNNADADVTAIVIQALAPYREDSGAKEAINRGIQCLSNIQKADASYESAGYETCESVAQVIVALCQMGISIEDERFVKANNTLIDALLSYYSNGMFAHLKGGKSNDMATDQATCALVAYSRMISGNNSLHDLSDGIIIKEVEAETTHKKVEETAAEESKKNKEKNKEKSKEKDKHQNQTEDEEESTEERAGERNETTVESVSTDKVEEKSTGKIEESMNTEEEVDTTTKEVKTESYLEDSNANITEERKYPMPGIIIGIIGFMGIWAMVYVIYRKKLNKKPAKDA